MASHQIGLRSEYVFEQKEEWWLFQRFWFFFDHFFFGIVSAEIGRYKEVTLWDITF